VQCIERYLSHYFDSIKSYGLRVLVKCASKTSRFLVLFFVVERNSLELVRILCRLEVSLDKRVDSIGLPLLAYIIFHVEYKILDTLPTMIALLAARANSHEVPKELWQNYLKALGQFPIIEVANAKRSLRWCTIEVQDALSRTMNLLQTYSLWKTNKISRSLPRMKQFVDAFKSTSLFETSFHLVGQLLVAT